MRRARVLAPLPRFYGVARVCDVSGACCVQLRGAGGEEGGLIVASTQSLASRWSFRDPTSTRDLHVPALLPTRGRTSGRFQSRFCGDEMVMMGGLLQRNWPPWEESETPTTRPWDASYVVDWLRLGEESSLKLDYIPRARPARGARQGTAGAYRPVGVRGSSRRRIGSRSTAPDHRSRPRLRF